MTRRIAFDGGDADFMYFRTPSWTRYGSEIEHNIVVCKRTGVVSCTCEDANFRKKQGHLVIEESKPCKHAAKLLTAFRRILTENLEVAIAA